METSCLIGKAKWKYKKEEFNVILGTKQSVLAWGKKEVHHDIYVVNCNVNDSTILKI